MTSRSRVKHDSHKQEDGGRHRLPHTVQGTVQYSPYTQPSIQLQQVNFETQPTRNYERKYQESPQLRHPQLQPNNLEQEPPPNLIVIVTTTPTKGSFVCE